MLRNTGQPWLPHFVFLTWVHVPLICSHLQPSKVDGGRGVESLFSLVIIEVMGQLLKRLGSRKFHLEVWPFLMDG